METKEQFVERMANATVKEMTPRRARLLRERMGIRLEDGDVRVDEEGILQVATELAENFLDLMHSLKRRPGFTSTLDQLTVEEAVDLAKKVGSAMATRIVLTLTLEL